MFVIYPKDPAEWQNAMFMLSYYHVLCRTYSDGDNEISAYMVVEGLPETDGTDRDDDLRMAEMCFQMNWHQEGKLCPHCVDHSDVFDCCGHLTFTKKINSAF